MPFPLLLSAMPSKSISDDFWSLPSNSFLCRSYGWVLPAGAAGQGRGSRSFVHVARSSALMHDASYLCPLLLR